VGCRQHLPVQLKVYNDCGREIACLVNENKTAGIYEVEFDITGLERGMYFYQVYTGCFVSERKMIVVE
jgi:hypothetical protein